MAFAVVAAIVSIGLKSPPCAHRAGGSFNVTQSMRREMFENKICKNCGEEIGGVNVHGNLCYCSSYCRWLASNARRRSKYANNERFREREKQRQRELYRRAKNLFYAEEKKDPFC
jgi:hypothetical protein